MARRNKVRIYRIIHTNHGKKKESICSEPTEEKIYKKFNELLKKNKKEVIFPMRYNNEKHVMVESEHELVILKCKDEFDNDVNKVKDDSGAYVNYQTNEENWIVIDRAPYNIEETFWVYGYHPRLQRKTFMWIFENFILKDSKNKYMFKNVVIYHNKLLIECDGNLEMVLCKNKSDSARMYNMLEEYAKKYKCKYVLFIGDIANSKYKMDWIQKIKDLSGWSTKKVTRMSTRD
jgi:hypothetical protein